MLVWAALVPVRPVINSLTLAYLGNTAGSAELLARVPLHAVLGVIVAISFVGTRLMGRRAQAAEASVALVDRQPQPSGELFRGLNSTWGPIVLTLLLTIVSTISTVTAFGVVAAVVDAPMLFFVTLPIAGFVWAYGHILISVDRIGQRTLDLDPFPEDRSLGLRSIGNLAFTAFAILSLAALLFLVFVAHYLADVVLGVAAFIFGAAVFVLSLWRVHNQMVEAKTRYVADARSLYSDAYAPLREHQDLATLGARADLLRAAEALEKRAESIHEWPIDDRTATRIAVMVTGVVTGLVVRGIFALLGM